MLTGWRMFHYLSLPDEPHEFERPAISMVRGRTADTEERDADLAAMMRGPEIGPSLYVSCCLMFRVASTSTIISI